ncbi:MAG: serine hydrolase domain-containing protein [Chloroflexota bacterium]
MSLPEIVAPEKAGFSSKRLDRLNKTMQGYVDDQRLAGIVTLLARKGQVAHFETFGQADIQADKPMAHDTLFRIYSMTKPITSIAAMMLFEDGMFQLHDPVSKYLPEFAETKVCVGSKVDGLKLVEQDPPMTVQHLLSHTAGLSYGWFMDTPVDQLYRKAGALRDKDMTLAEFGQAIASLPLVYQPGTNWRYSMATDVLGHFIEVVSGMSLADFFADNIFKPLGMTDTAFYVPADKQDRFAAMYTLATPPPGTLIMNMLKDDSGVIEGHNLKAIDLPSTSPYLTQNNFLSGGGGLISSTADYLRFAQMLANGGTLDGHDIISRKTLEIMATNHVDLSAFPLTISTPMPGYGFGLGFSVLMDVAQSGELGSVGSYGWSGAASTTYWVDPVEDLIAIFMAQFMPTGHYPVHSEFQNLVYQALM